MKRWAVLLLLASCAAAQKTAAPVAKSKPRDVHDRRWGVRFTVPTGWAFTQRDGEVSTFHLDALTAGADAQVRGVASLDHNPYPESTLASAMVYFSVQPKSDESACAKQAGAKTDTQDIDGMSFVHGRNERRGACVEQRADVFTAFRKHSCYRFDLVLNTFCAASSGASEMTAEQIEDVESQMAELLSSVWFDWEKNGPHAVAPAEAPKASARKPMSMR